MPIFLILALVLGLGGGTAVVADSAKPGDVLFGVDRAVENARIRFAGGEDKKNELRIRFAEERVEEIKELADKNSEDKENEDSIETLSDEDREKVSIGVEETLNLISALEDSGDTRVAAIVSILNSYMQNLPTGSEISFDGGKLKIEYEVEDGEKGKLEVKQKKDGEIRIKSESEDGRVRVEIKDGRIEIKSKVEDDDDGSSVNRGLEEVEAEILDGKAIVEVELNDEKTIFTVEATDKAAIIAAVLARFPSLSRAEVEAVIEINEDEDEDDEEEDEEKDDEDDEEGEDNSGSGRD